MNLRTNFARALLTGAVVAAIPAAAADSPDLGRLKAHIGSVQTMTANFVQTDARGRSAAGTLQLKRPGKVRFAYGSGDLLLVANGKTLTFIDYQVGQKSSWPLGRTPLGVLLSDSPNLKGRAQIVPSGDSRVVSVRARDPAQYG
jgi:outer membrane lipoprotein-sorting protein